MLKKNYVLLLLMLLTVRFASEAAERFIVKTRPDSQQSEQQKKC